MSESGTQGPPEAATQVVSDAVSVVWTAPGMPVARAVSAAVRELQAGDPLALVRILTPDGVTNDSLRRALPFAGGVCGAEIGGTVRVAREIAAPLLGERRVAPPVAVLAAVQQVLNDPAQRPAALNGCWQYPATHDALVRSFASLNGVFTLDGDEPEYALAQLAGGRRSARAVTTVVSRVRAALVANGLLDQAELIRVATASVGVGGSQPPLVVVVTQQFNPAHAGFVAALISASVRCRIVVAATSSAELSVATHVSRLVGVEVVEPALAGAAAVAPHVLSCPDHDEEIRVVARRIIGLLNDGVTADQITVYYPPSGPHRSAIAAQLGGAGIPVRGQVRPALQGSIAGQILRLLLAALGSLDRRVVIELCRLAPLGWAAGEAGQHHSGSARRRHPDAWLHRCRELGVVFEADWKRARLPDPAETDPEVLGNHLTPALTGFVDRQQHFRRQVLGASTWPDIASAVEAWWRDHCGTEAWRLDHWLGYPAWQLEAAQQMEAVLTDLGQVGQFGLRPDLAVAERLLTAALGEDVITAESKGAGVAVSQIVEGAGSITRHAFIVGANDGMMPGRRADDLVITAAHGIEPFGVLTSPANRPLRDHRGFVGAVAGAAESVTITFARHDLRNGGGLFPSTLLHGMAADVVTSHAAEVHGSGEAWLDTGEWFAADPGRRHPRLARRRRAITSRLQHTATHYDGMVGALNHYGAVSPLEVTRADGTRRAVGITSIEAMVTCGMHFFVRHVLGAKPPDTDATELTDIDGRERGTLLHSVFDRLVREWLEANPGAHRPWIANEQELAQRRARAAEIFVEESSGLRERNRVGHPQAWAARSTQILAAIDQALLTEMTEAVCPVASEFAFGLARPDALDPLVWPHPEVDGGVVLNGSVDRINRATDGTLALVDLKTGRSSAFVSVKPQTPFGTKNDKLQPVFYAVAVEQLLGEPVSASGYRFMGKAKADAPVTLPITDDARAALQHRLGEIISQIQHGEFRPGLIEPTMFGSTCPTCSPDDLGMDEIDQRVKRWITDASASAEGTGGEH